MWLPCNGHNHLGMTCINTIAESNSYMGYCNVAIVFVAVGFVAVGSWKDRAFHLGCCYTSAAQERSDQRWRAGRCLSFAALQLCQFVRSD